MLAALGILPAQGHFPLGMVEHLGPERNLVLQVLNNYVNTLPPDHRTYNIASFSGVFTRITSQLRILLTESAANELRILVAPAAQGQAVVTEEPLLR